MSISIKTTKQNTQISPELLKLCNGRITNYQLIYKMTKIWKSNQIQKLVRGYIVKTAIGIGLSVNSYAEISEMPYYKSYMSEKFRSFPVDQVLNTERVKILNRYLEATGEAKIESICIFTLIRMAIFCERLLGKPSKITVERKRKQRKGYKAKASTYKAVWEYVPIKKREKIYHKYIVQEKKYNQIRKIGGIIIGRLHNMINPAITQKCLMLDKHGLFEVKEGETYDTNTLIWCLLFKSELDARKAFTLNAQIQGGLNPILKEFLEKVLERSKNTDWSLICSLYPMEKYVRKLSKEKQVKLLRKWNHSIYGMKHFLTLQWEKGVDKCAQRGWLVPWRGLELAINTSGWNSAAGAWNNAIRHIRVLSEVLNEPPMFIFSVPKLTAGDQAIWASYTGMKVDPKVEVIKELVLEHKIYPWSGYEWEKERYIIDMIKMVCNKHKLPLHRMLGMPKEREDKLIRHCDMICGVNVEGLDNKVKDCLKEVGFAGYKSFK